MKATSGNDRLMMPNFLSPIAISVAEKGNLGFSAPGIRQPGSRPLAPSFARRLWTSRSLSSPHGSRSGPPRRPPRNSRTGPPVQAVPDPEVAVSPSRKPSWIGSPAAARAEARTGTGQPALSSRTAYFGRRRTAKACAPLSTRAHALSQSARLRSSAGSASRPPFRARTVLSDVELRQLPLPTSPRGLCRRFRFRATNVSPIGAPASCDLRPAFDLDLCCKHRMSTAAASQGGTPADTGDPPVASPITKLTRPSISGSQPEGSLPEGRDVPIASSPASTMHAVSKPPGSPGGQSARKASFAPSVARTVVFYPSLDPRWHPDPGDHPPRTAVVLSPKESPWRSDMDQS